VQALFFVVPDEDSAARLREKVPADRSVVGTIGQIAETFAAYRDAGFEEVCVPDFTLGADAAQRIEAYANIWENAASLVR